MEGRQDKEDQARVVITEVGQTFQKPRRFLGFSAPLMKYAFEPFGASVEEDVVWEKIMRKRQMQALITSPAKVKQGRT